MSRNIVNLSTLPDITVQGPPSTPGLPPPPRVSPSARNPRTLAPAPAASPSGSELPVHTSSPALAGSHEADVSDEDASSSDSSAPATPTLDDDASALPSPANSPPSRAFRRESVVQDFGRLREPASVSEARLNFRIQDLSNDVGLLEAKLEAYSANTHAFMLEVIGGLEKRLGRVIEDSEARVSLKIDGSEARVLSHVMATRDATVRTQVSQLRAENRMAQAMVEMEVDLTDRLSLIYSQQGALHAAWARAT